MGIGVFKCITNNSPKKVTFDPDYSEDDTEAGDITSDQLVFNRGEFRKLYVLGKQMRPGQCNIRTCKKKRTEEIRSVKIIKKN